MDVEKYIEITTFSLSKIVEKSNKLRQNSQSVLERENARLQNVLLFSIQLKEKDIEKMVGVIEEFDNHYSTLKGKTHVKVQIKHDAKLFRMVCENIKMN